MNSEYAFLVEKEAMWAEMLIQALKDNEIFCVSQPVYGAGLTLKAGMQEHYKIYVAEKDREKAEELYREMFLD